MASSLELANEYYKAGMDSIRGNNIEGGVENFIMSLGIYKEIKEHKQCILSHYGLGVAYSMLGLDNPLVDTIMDGISYANEFHVNGSKNLFYSIICDKYIQLNDFDNALSYGLLAVQDIEQYGTIYEYTYATLLVCYLNVAISYVETRQYKEATNYLEKAISVATEHDIHNHDFTFEVLKARVENGMGNPQYVHDNMDTLLNYVKNVNVTLEDYIQDLSMLVSLFIGMKLFDNALQIAQLFDCSSAATVNNKLRLESAKMYMRIYKAQGDMEKYRDACVKYAEDDILIHDTDSQNHLVGLDTRIALSIVSTGIDYI